MLHNIIWLDIEEEEEKPLKHFYFDKVVSYLGISNFNITDKSWIHKHWNQNVKLLYLYCILKYTWNNFILTKNASSLQV